MKNGVLLGCDTQFLAIRMMPKLLHVLPVSNDATLDGILEVKDTSLCLGFLSAANFNVCPCKYEMKRTRRRNAPCSSCRPWVQGDGDDRQWPYRNNIKETIAIAY